MFLASSPLPPLWTAPIALPDSARASAPPVEQLSRRSSSWSFPRLLPQLSVAAITQVLWPASLEARVFCRLAPIYCTALASSCFRRSEPRARSKADRDHRHGVVIPSEARNLSWV